MDKEPDGWDSPEEKRIQLLRPGRIRKTIRLACIVITIAALILYFQKPGAKGIEFVALGALLIVVCSDRQSYAVVLMRNGKSANLVEPALIGSYFTMGLGILFFLYGLYMLIPSVFS